MFCSKITYLCCLNNQLGAAAFSSTHLWAVQPANVNCTARIHGLYGTRMRAEVLLPAKIHYPGFICKFSKYYFCKIKPYDAANKDTEICLDEVLVVSLYSYSAAFPFTRMNNKKKMKITLVRDDGKVNTLRTLKIELLLEQMKTEVKAQPVSKMREALRYTLPGNSIEGVRKVPKVIPAAAFVRKEGVMTLNEYNGIVMMEVNHLSGRTEADEIKELVKEFPQTFLAFTGSSGKSVKYGYGSLIRTIACRSHASR